MLLKAASQKTQHRLPQTVQNNDYNFQAFSPESGLITDVFHLPISQKAQSLFFSFHFLFFMFTFLFNNLSRLLYLQTAKRTTSVFTLYFWNTKIYSCLMPKNRLLSIQENDKFIIKNNLFFKK